MKNTISLSVRHMIMQFLYTLIPIKYYIFSVGGGNTGAVVANRLSENETYKYVTTC